MSDDSILNFGIITDIQYADCDDAYNFTRTHMRYYRNAITLLESAIAYWHKLKYPLDFVVQLGDAIDGLCKKNNKSKEALEAVMAAFDTLECPVLHILGNHDFYNFSRATIENTGLCSARLDVCRSEPGEQYYMHQPHPRLIVIGLDTYEISVLGYEGWEDNFKEATDILNHLNPNVDKNYSDGLYGKDRRYVKFNGGCSRKQLQWFDSTLEWAHGYNINVIILAHGLAYDQGVDELCLSWNCDELMESINKYSACIVAYLAGHDHLGSHNVDGNGVHHISFPAIVETEPGNNSFAIGRIYHQKLKIVGVGRGPSYNIPLRFQIQQDIIHQYKTNTVDVQNTSVNRLSAPRKIADGPPTSQPRKFSVLPGQKGQKPRAMSVSPTASPKPPTPK